MRPFNKNLENLGKNYNLPLKIVWMYDFFPTPQLSASFVPHHCSRLEYCPFPLQSGQRNRNGPGFFPAKDCQLDKILPLQQQQQHYFKLLYA